MVCLGAHCFAYKSHWSHAIYHGAVLQPEQCTGESDTSRQQKTWMLNECGTKSGQSSVQASSALHWAETRVEADILFQIATTQWALTCQDGQAMMLQQEWNLWCGGWVEKKWICYKSQGCQVKIAFLRYALMIWAREAWMWYEDRSKIYLPNEIHSLFWHYLLQIYYTVTLACLLLPTWCCPFTRCKYKLNKYQSKYSRCTNLY